MNTDPNTWNVPIWHPDCGDPKTEFEMLRSFSNALLGESDEYVVELDCFEDGYMKVDIYKDKRKFAELHIVDSKESEKKYGLFMPFDEDDEDEFYFTNIDEGIKSIFDVCASPKVQFR